jgi:hypothetical protein
MATSNRAKYMQQLVQDAFNAPDSEAMVSLKLHFSPPTSHVPSLSHINAFLGHLQ